MRCISILSDFGLEDGFVGVMHAVILNIAPTAQIIDLTHQIDPQNILQAAVILADSYRYFPSGSIHLAIVDPGVGTSRASIAARVGEHYFVTPDNGLLTRVFDKAESRKETIQIIKLDKPRYWLADVSNTFHGRDIFAPVAAYLSNEVPLAELGSQMENPVRLDIPLPVRTKDGWQAEVLYCDYFGNLVTNLEQEHLIGSKILAVQIDGLTIKRITSTFGEAKSGEAIVLIDSGGHLSICQVNGNASAEMHICAGAQVEVITAN